MRLTSNPAVDQYPAFSPDGELVAFVRDRTRVFVVPSQGGVEREVGTVSDPRIAFSPDGQFIAAGGPAAPGAAGAGLVLLPLHGGARRTLTAPPRGSSDIAPAFSPDGSRLAFQRIPTTAVSDIWVADASGASARRITFDDRLLEGPAWTQDGQSLIFSSARLGAGRLWRVPASGGTPEALPDTGPGSTMPAVPRRGDRLAFVASLEDTNMWEVPIGPTVRLPGRRVPGSAHPPGSMAVPTSRLTEISWFSSPTVPGRDEIFIGSADSVAARRDHATSPVSRRAPSVHLASRPTARRSSSMHASAATPTFTSSRRSGGAPRRITTDPGADVVPVWSPDGAWIYFTSRRGGPPQTWRVERDGGLEEQVTTASGFRCAVFARRPVPAVQAGERVNTSLWRRPVQGWTGGTCAGRRTGTTADSRPVRFLAPHADGHHLSRRRPPDVAGQAARFLLQSYDAVSRRIETLATLPAPPALAAGGLWPSRPTAGASSIADRPAAQRHQPPAALSVTFAGPQFEVVIGPDRFSRRYGCRAAPRPRSDTQQGGTPCSKVWAHAWPAFSRLPP